MWRKANGRILAAALILAVSSIVPVAGRADPPAAASRGVFTFAASGDLLIGKRPRRDRNFDEIARIFRGADAAMGNGEVAFADISRGRLHPYSALYVLTIGDPQTPLDLKALGINMVSLANNHSMDWGADGARETVDNLASAGIVAAGFGETRSEARAARIIATPHGRVGLVSATSSPFPGEAATNSVDGVPGGAGISVLRTTRINIVTPTEFDVLRKIRAEHNPGVSLRMPKPSATDITLFGVTYRVGASPSNTYEINPEDEADYLGAIRSARPKADYLMATFHFHEDPDCDHPATGDEGSAYICGVPPDFIEKIAHDSIDAGADGWIGHGPHVLLGIEIYKGKPIFYSLGNLYFEPETVSRQLDAYPAGYDPAKDNDEAWFKKLWAYYERDTTMYESVIAVDRFSGGTLKEVRLYPVDLGAQRGEDRGIPVRASPSMAAKILQRLQVLSARYGTKIAIEGGIGIIRIER